MPNQLYILPTMVANRYVYNRVIRETEHTVVYGAVQRDIQRDVVVETLRPECMRNAAKVQFFLETARLQANVEDAFMGCVLELFFADGTWHYASESIDGESLDALLLAGRKLSSSSICELMICLCRSCIYMDIVDVDNKPFSLANVYLSGSSFRYDNPVTAGTRSHSATRIFLSSAAEALPALLDEKSPLAEKLAQTLSTICSIVNWSHLQAVVLDEQFVSLQAEIMHEIQSQLDDTPDDDEETEPLDET